MSTFIIQKKKEELQEEMKKVQESYNNLLNNMKAHEARLLQIQGALQALEELISPKEEAVKEEK